MLCVTRSQQSIALAAVSHGFIECHSTLRHDLVLVCPCLLRLHHIYSESSKDR